eukprot:5834918-Amphidinium_carterae.1
MWCVLVDAEKEARRDDGVRSLLREMVWPNMQTCRLVLARLAETDFKHIPESVERLLRECAE